MSWNAPDVSGQRLAKILDEHWEIWGVGERQGTKVSFFDAVAIPLSIKMFLTIDNVFCHPLYHCFPLFLDS